MKAISLFAGCGGADFGLKKLGVDVVYANEILPYACESLKTYFPHTDVENADIREITKFPKVDLVVGGYPCQSFSLAGKRDPEKDPRSYLFKEFARAVDSINPKYFVAENVSGMKGVAEGRFLSEQRTLFSNLGSGYRISERVVDARDYGIPQRRRRIFIVGVRSDLDQIFAFPRETHGDEKKIRKAKHLLPYTSHGDAIAHLPVDCPGEFYERPHDEKGHMSWYYMSRNRKAAWDAPAFCVVANFRHITLHPACQTMHCVWSNLADGYKQKWEFSGQYEHLEADPARPTLEVPRRLSWRECAAIQTFPKDFEPTGKLEHKFEQIGNAIPPQLFEKMFQGLIDGTALDDFDAHLSK
jgi:DNA (cytosine-5)-methyltransferase 1